jgi:hypothetical protein
MDMLCILLATMILFHFEHGYARLNETIVILQMTPLELWSLGSLASYVSKYW